MPLPTIPLRYIWVLLRNSKRLRVLIYCCLTAGSVYAARRLLSHYLHHGLFPGQRQQKAEKWLSFCLRKFEISNQMFPQQLNTLLKILRPRMFSTETGLILIHTVILLSRTFMSVFVAHVEGVAVKAIVERNPRAFLTHLCSWFLLALPATFINSMIKFFEGCLSIACRTKLVKFAYEQYFKNDVYYRISNLDSRLKNVDHCLTEDIAAFSALLSHLYSQLTKPIFDIAFISLSTLIQMRRRGTSHIAHLSVTLSIVVFFITITLLKCASPRFGELTAEEAKRKGMLSFMQSRIVGNAEEIAFYGGHRIEKFKLLEVFSELKSQIMLIYRKRAIYVMFEQFLLKYVWSAMGMIMIAISVFFSAPTEGSIRSTNGTGSVSERTRHFTTSRYLLQFLADAAERLMTSYKSVAHLSGYTSRICEMFVVFEDARKQRFTQQFEESLMVEKEENEKSSELSIAPRAVAGEVVEEGNFIRLDNVSVITPCSKVIAEHVSFELHPGMHLMIVGPNGCGKSSLFRVIGGLWPLYSGYLQKPLHKDLFYIPQKPYMTLGTLREQVIYPDTESEMRQKGFSDSDLSHILDKVFLGHIVQREGGWSASRDWMLLLSGGEKQRLALARVFYHRPLFAMLDECTSAISTDVEGSIYQSLIDAKVTLLTVSHRHTLWQYHKYLLQYDKSKTFIFGEISQLSLNYRQCEQCETDSSTQ
ncbi:hypothetical protein AB6A40_003265 [Gnathostoma spinigerum]|uniref:ABC transporter domain-containing protein n=1 Tax=Gnathostoma spinigerum TaxID=75299 RepID=A0ABD6EGQ4_9BILA